MKQVIDSTIWTKLATMARDWVKTAHATVEYLNGSIIITIAPAKPAKKGRVSR